MAKAPVVRQPKFVIGDIVTIKSGGPQMAVHSSITNTKNEFNGNYKCQWFAGKKLEIGVFPEDSLEVFVPKQETKED